jgi:NAD(P)-dependent dehydrogenase (short-subunit alcohol dehydrogenase family)
MKTNHRRIALITGGNRGIGFETARQLGKQGIVVVIGVRELKKGKEAVKTLKAEGFQAEAVEVDVSKPKTFDGAYDYLESHHDKLDILINNAGIRLETAAGPSALPMKILRETFETNFFGTVALTQRLLPLIRKSDAGRIVNLSSVLGSLTLHSDPKSGIYSAKSFAYDASKTALNAFTIQLAYELRDTNIKVNSAHPGWVKTDMGGPDAEMEITDGAKTSVRLATLPAGGPSGGYFHMDQRLPW